jgi:hypothetical protein
VIDRPTAGEAHRQVADVAWSEGDKGVNAEGQPMSSITSSVGYEGVNKPSDVRAVQTLLNVHIKAGKLQPWVGAPLVVDGGCGAKTRRAIYVFQFKCAYIDAPDAKVDPGGLTLAALKRPPGIVRQMPPPPWAGGGAGGGGSPSIDLETKKLERMLNSDGR